VTKAKQYYSRPDNIVQGQTRAVRVDKANKAKQNIVRLNTSP